MIFKLNKILVIHFVFSTTMLFASCGLISELRAIVSSPQDVSGEIKIKNFWTEIIPPQPLNASVKIHKFSVQTDEIAGYDQSDKNAQTLEFKNGKTGKIEAFLYDENGEEYKLGIVGVGGKNGGFYLGKVHNPDDRNSKKPDFPQDKIYRKLKIRSDVEFQVRKIEWISEIQK